MYRRNIGFGQGRAGLEIMEVIKDCKPSVMGILESPREFSVCVCVRACVSVCVCVGV